MLLNALKEYSFAGQTLWRMYDGKDLAKVELTFHKKPMNDRHYYKKRSESKRQLTPSAGEWARQPTATTRPTASRPTLQVRRTTPHLERETPPPSTQTFQHQPETLTLPRCKTTTTIYKPAPSSSPDAPQRRKQGLLHQPETSPTLQRDITTTRSRSRTHNEKYDLHEVHGCKFSRFDANIIKATDGTSRQEST